MPALLRGLGVPGRGASVRDPALSHPSPPNPQGPDPPPRIGSSEPRAAFNAKRRGAPGRLAGLLHRPPRAEVGRGAMWGGRGAMWGEGRRAEGRSPRLGSAEGRSAPAHFTRGPASGVRPGAHSPALRPLLAQGSAAGFPPPGPRRGMDSGGEGGTRGALVCVAKRARAPPLRERRPPPQIADCVKLAVRAQIEQRLPGTFGGIPIPLYRHGSRVLDSLKATDMFWVALMENHCELAACKLSPSLPPKKRQ